MSGAQVFHIALGTFKHRGCGTGTKGADVLGLQPVGEAEYQRNFRADYNKFDPVIDDEGHKPVDVVSGDVNTFRILGDTGISGRTPQRVDQRGA